MLVNAQMVRKNFNEATDWEELNKQVSTFDARNLIYLILGLSFVLVMASGILAQSGQLQDDIQCSVYKEHESFRKRDDITSMYTPWMSTSTAVDQRLPSYDIPLEDIIGDYERFLKQDLGKADISNFLLIRGTTRHSQKTKKRKVNVVSQWFVLLCSLPNLFISGIKRLEKSSKRLQYWAKKLVNPCLRTVIKKYCYVLYWLRSYVCPYLWLGNIGIFIEGVHITEPHLFMMVTFCCVYLGYIFDRYKETICINIFLDKRMVYEISTRIYTSNFSKFTATITNLSKKDQDRQQTLLDVDTTTCATKLEPSIRDIDDSTDAITESEKETLNLESRECVIGTLKQKGSKNVTYSATLHVDENVRGRFEHKVNNDFIHARLYLSQKVPYYESQCIACIPGNHLLKYEMYRLLTFQRLKDLNASVLILAKRGFYCTPQNEIKCCICGQTLENMMATGVQDSCIFNTISHECRSKMIFEMENISFGSDLNKRLFENIAKEFKPKLKRNFQKDNEVTTKNMLNSGSQELHGATEDLEELPQYKMDSEPRGIAVIINNEKFSSNSENGVKLESREGSKKDADKLQKLLTDLRFDVRYYENQSAEGMVKIAIDIASIDHSPYNCLVFCVLSHGGYTYLYGTRGVACRIKTITDPFISSRCPSLAGKPKCFFFQSCQGVTSHQGHQLPTDSSEHDGFVPQDDKLEDSLPVEADFLMSYATVPGFVSYRCPVNGSWYISSLVKNLRKYRKYDIVSILTKVNNEVSRMSVEEEGNICKQMPCIQSTLRKFVFFR